MWCRIIAVIELSSFTKAKRKCFRSSSFSMAREESAAASKHPYMSFNDCFERKSLWLSSWSQRSKALSVGANVVFFGYCFAVCSGVATQVRNKLL